MKQCIYTSRKPMIQLGWRSCARNILTEFGITMKLVRLIKCVGMKPIAEPG